MAIAKGESQQTARFKILSDPNRIRILRILKDQPLTVNHIVEKVGVERTLVSHHLKIMRENKMIVSKKCGRHVFYSIHEDLAAECNNSFNFGCCVISFNEASEKH